MCDFFPVAKLIFKMGLSKARCRGATPLLSVAIHLLEGSHDQSTMSEVLGIITMHYTLKTSIFSNYNWKGGALRPRFPPPSHKDQFPLQNIIP